MGHKNDVALNSVPAISSRGKVLLASVDRDDLHDYGGLLEGYGFLFRGCESYEESISLLNSETFDFIIVSQGSPKFEGRCVLERANQIDRRLPVVVIARCLDMRCYLEAMQLGAVDYLAEPISPKNLAWALETHAKPGVAPAEQNYNVSPAVRHRETLSSRRDRPRAPVRRDSASPSA
jgi:DNA-binding NtrC family response regulator